VLNDVTLPETHRAAAYIITASEGSNLHLDDCDHVPYDFDPATRDRFLAGTLIPGSWYIQAQPLPLVSRLHPYFAPWM